MKVTGRVKAISRLALAPRGFPTAPRHELMLSPNVEAGDACEQIITAPPPR